METDALSHSNRKTQRIPATRFALSTPKYLLKEKMDGRSFLPVSMANSQQKKALH
jgi:hypothetical protein